MAEGTRYEIEGKSVRLPGGGTFDFQWELGGIEGGEGLAEAGMGAMAFEAKVREICDISRVLAAGHAVPNGSVDFTITTLMHLYRRIDGALHAFAVTQQAGPALIERALASVTAWDAQLDQVSEAAHRAVVEARERAAERRAEAEATDDSGEEG